MMTDAARFQRVAELFEAARPLPRAERDEHLRRACAGDPGLLVEVLRLLTHHDEPDTPLDTPAVPPGLSLEMLTPAAEPPLPERIGRYRVLGRLGLGGMGVVYLAEQDHPRRQVAVKVIRPGVVGRTMLRRFELEAATLGRLQHEGIAQIYEAGTFDDGAGPRPFFAMERIEGLPLTRFAEERGLDTEERLRLFAGVCDAVHHAHQRGVIHRDIKPGNILVTEGGHPKVLDFGVARATDSDMQVTAPQTHAGQLVGTIPYMSPEQLGGRESDVDVRSDVYSLGVVLYELLSGRLPHDLGETSMLGAARKIAETEPIPLGAVRRAYRGDLSTIVGRALAKEPERRYQSASDLGADVRRFLAHEPILARPATAAYHIRKFARRHVALVAGAGVALLAVVGGSLAVGWQAARTSAEAQTRREVGAFLRETLTSVDPEQSGGRAPTVLDLLDGASDRLGDRFEAAPLVGAELAVTIGETYHALGQFDRAEPHLRRAAETYRAELGPGEDLTLGAVASLAFTLHELDRSDEAQALLAPVLPIARGRAGAGAASVLVKQAIVYDNTGRETEAGDLYEEIYRLNLVRLGAAADDTLNARMNLGCFLMEHQRSEEALPHLRGVADAFRAKLGDGHPYTLAAIANLGACCCKLGRLDEGAALLTEAVDRTEALLGPHHLHTLRRLKNLAVAQGQLGNLDAWREASTRLLRDSETALGKSHTQTISALEQYVAAVGLGGELDRSESVALEWYASLRDSVGEDHRSTRRVALLVANVYDEMQRPDEYARWLDIAGRSPGED
ncbi:MAG: serine/threonine protein kinase [Phycisphaerales bacterium]|nr:serine/threonine protein kinase [Phycisphaerales bacterium]